MTECQHGRELLIQQQMIEAGNSLLKMAHLIESLPDSALAPINDSLFPNSERYVRNHLMLLKKLSQEASILSHQIKLLQLNLLPKEEKATSTNSANKLRLSPCLDVSCLQCSNGFSSSPGLMSQDIENQATRSS